MNLRLTLGLAALLALVAAAVLLLAPRPERPDSGPAPAASPSSAGTAGSDAHPLAENFGAPRLELPVAEHAPGSQLRESSSGLRADLQSRLRDLELRALTDPGAFDEITALQMLCSNWRSAAATGAPEDRASQPAWAFLADLCPEDFAERFAAIESAAVFPPDRSLFPVPTKMPETADEFAQRDAFLSDRLASVQEAAVAFEAAIVFFDFERFAQWAGPMLPMSIIDERSYLRSRIGLDVAWLFACRLGLPCGPYDMFTLNECWVTPGCVPGGAARQVVQMRRSPLELQLVDSMVERLMRLRRR